MFGMGWDEDCFGVWKIAGYEIYLGRVMNDGLEEKRSWKVEGVGGIFIVPLLLARAVWCQLQCFPANACLLIA